MSWVERATELLHDTESIREEVRIGSGGVVVTNQRLLVFTPDSQGANFRQVDLPNVESVERRTIGERRFLMPGLKAGVLGLVMVAFGYAFNFDQFAEGITLDSGTGAASAVGVGGLLGMVQTFIELLAMLDDLLRIVGGLALAFTAVALGAYVWSRDSRLVASVAGEDDIELPGSGVDDARIDRLRTAIQGEGVAPATTPGGLESAGESERNDPLEEKLDFGDGASATDRTVGETVDAEPMVDQGEAVTASDDSATVDEAAVENVLDGLEEAESDSEETTEDGTLDLTDPKDL